MWQTIKVNPSLFNVMATLAHARTAATGSYSVVDLAFDVVPPPV